MPGRFENFVVSAIVRSPFHALLGNSFAVISVRGRRTGKPISTPVNVLREGSTLTVVSLHTRSWWRNVRSGARASLRLAGETLDVRGEVLERPDQVREGLTHYFAQRPGYAKYFGLRMVDGQLSPDDLQRVAAERVIVRLHVS